MHKIELRAHQLIQAIVVVCGYFFRLLNPRKKHWIIAERGFDARDNGYHFYRHLKENHPEIKVYFLIDKKSVDYEKVKTDFVQYGSIKSFWLFGTAEKIVSTHYGLILPKMGTNFFIFLGLHKKLYFLQHGVIYNEIPMLHADISPMKLFICGAYPEYTFVRDTFGHPDGVVQYTGLARYDSLHDFTVKKQVLVMPTWRITLRTEDDFLKSDYYRAFQDLISNEALIRYLENEGIQLVFYPHFEIQKWLHNFVSNSPNVVIASFEKYDVQALLKESALLVTDYSSVFFDFAYMNKPVIYYQFDSDYFYANHYSKGYFDYNTMGFGPVCDNVDKVVQSIIESTKRDFAVPDEYSERMNKFFVLRDKNNCKRIYEAIVKK